MGNRHNNMYVLLYYNYTLYPGNKPINTNWNNKSNRNAKYKIRKPVWKCREVFFHLHSRLITIWLIKSFNEHLYATLKWAKPQVGCVNTIKSNFKWNTDHFVCGYLNDQNTQKIDRSVVQTFEIQTAEVANVIAN